VPEAIVSRESGPALPNAHGAWLEAIRRGDFPSAWRVSDEVLAGRLTEVRDWTIPRHQQWIWDGRPLRDQRVLVRCYHGLGDTLQFVRFVPDLGRLAREVIVWAQPALLPLLAQMPGIGTLLPLHDGTPEVDYDVDIESMELPHALRTSASSLASRVPYLRVQPQPRYSERLSIGLLARAGDWDARRSVPDDLLTERLRSVPGSALFNLQLAPPLPNMPDLSSPDILTLAERLTGLDLVITADTMLAHLAGALGLRTWTLLPFEADWRWLKDRSDSPWYPSMRLFRQPRPGAWPAVLDDVAEALTCWPFS
jgi:hypothetical protein